MNYQKIEIDYFGEKIDVQPTVELYEVKAALIQKDLPCLAIQLNSALELDDEEMPNGEKIWEPFAMLTKSFGEYIGFKNAAYIDINNCPFAEQFLKLGIAKDTGLKMESGHCVYPLWVFNEDFLREIGGENYKAYAREFDRYMSPNAIAEEDDEIDESADINNDLI